MTMWRCEYCGHQQNTEARKCADCGGPRGADVNLDIVRALTELPESYLPDSFPLYQEYLTAERIRAQKALADAVRETFTTIGGVFLPVLENIL